MVKSNKFNFILLLRILGLFIIVWAAAAECRTLEEREKIDMGASEFIVLCIMIAAIFICCRQFWKYWKFSSSNSNIPRVKLFNELNPAVGSIPNQRYVLV